MDDYQDYYSSQILSIQKAIAKEKDIFNILEPEVSNLEETAYIQRERLKKIKEEIATYDRKLDQSSNNKDLSSTSILNKTDIYSERENLLKGSNKSMIEENSEDQSLMEVDFYDDPDTLFIIEIMIKCANKHIEKTSECNFPSSNNQPHDAHLTNITCRSILLIFVADNPNDPFNLSSKYQFFRITKDMKFIEVLNSSLRLWGLDQLGKVGDYCLRMLEDDYELSKEFIPSSEVIDQYLKTVSKSRTAIVVMTEKIKENIDAYTMKNIMTSNSDKKEEAKTKKIEKKIEGRPLAFFNKFMGVASYMKNKIEKKENSTEDENAITTSSNLSKGISLFLRLVDVLMLAFTFTTLVRVYNTNSSYYLNNDLKKMLNHSYFLQTNNSDTIQYDIQERLKIFFLDDQARQNSLLFSAKVTGQIRISFYRVEPMDPCNSYFASIKTTITKFNKTINCYYPYYNSTTQEIKKTTILQRGSSLIWGSNNVIVNSNLTYVIFDNSTNPAQVRQIDPSHLSWVSTYIYNNMISLISKDENPYSISGVLGVYMGDQYDMYISSKDINNNVFNQIMTNVFNTTLVLTDSGLRSIVVSFTIFDFPMNKFLYVYLVYEVTASGYVIFPRLSIKSFHINIYKQEGGPLILILDNIRLVLAIIILLGCFYEVLANKNKTSNFFFILRVVFFNFFVSVLFFIAFGIRQANLNQTFTDASINLDIQTAFEYYYTYNAYYQNILLECFLAFALLFKILLHFSHFEGIKMFWSYLGNSFWKMFYYMIFIGGATVCLTVFANNLWGQRLDEFIDFGSSLYSVLLFSLGSINMNLIMNSVETDPIWNFLFFLPFFGVLIFFFLNTFTGIFFEVYRITVLIKGNSQQIKKRKGNEEKEEKRIK